MTTVGILGSTGSIGTQTIEVIEAAPDDYEVLVLAAGSNVDLLAAQAGVVRPRVVALSDESKLDALRSQLDASVEIVAGADAIADVAGLADVAINGVVGFAGLPATLACLYAGKRLGLANKESLIAAGPIVQQARSTPGAELVPVDSEHAAVHQCLGSGRAAPARLQITASGGPFRGWSVERLRSVTVADALAHPTWSMGPKITVDSSTLMNKGLEVIEAFELFGEAAGNLGFGLGYDDIDVVVHPQSIVHSMVTFADGSTIAQLSEPDMRLPIGYALAYPGRLPHPFGAVDWSQPKTLEFEPPDRQAFPCLDLAFEAGRVGECAPAWLSAANEVAVDAFLNGRIGWAEIPLVIEGVMMSYDGTLADTLEAVLQSDISSRNLAEEAVGKREKA